VSGPGTPLTGEEFTRAIAALRTGFGAGPQQLTVVVTQRHLDWLAGQWAGRDERIAALEAEVARLKAINDTLRSDRAWLAGLAEGAPIDAVVSVACGICGRRMMSLAGFGEEEANPPVDLRECARPDGDECRAVAAAVRERDQRIAALEAEVERLRAINDTLRSDRVWLAGLAEGAPIDVEGGTR
jgi:uncharacterized small protein (DUF1192 family)